VDGLCDEDFIITQCLDPDKEYYVMVDGGSALGINGAMHEGDFSLRFYFPREGGLNPCLYNATTNKYGAPRIGTGAIPTGGSAQLLNNSNFCGLSDADLVSQGIPIPAWGVDNGVFYVFRPPASGSVKITATSDPVIGPALGFLSGDEIDLQLAVYEATGAAGSCTPPSWQIVGSASNSVLLDGFNEYVVVNCLDPNKDYYLLVDGTGLNTVGFFDLLIEDYGITTPNDLQCDAIDIVAAQSPALQAQWNACNQNVTLTLNNQNNYCADNINEPVPSNWPGTAKIVWYKFVAPPSGGVHFELNTVTNNPFAPEYLNAKLAVYDLPDGEDLCTYLFTNADEIASDYDVDVPPFSTGESMNNNNILFPDNRFVYCLTPGRTYYLAVDGQQEPLTSDWDRGEFSISIESSPRDAAGPNNAICNNKFLGNLTFSPLGTTVTTVPPPARGVPCMRAENNFCADNLINGVPYNEVPAGFFGIFGGNYSVNQAVWYRFVAPWTTAVNIRALNDPGSLGDQIDLQIAVFGSSNNACTGDLTLVKGEWDPLFFDETIQVNCLEPGRMYFVMVTGSNFDIITGSTLEGYFELEIEVAIPTELAPPNDDICDAISVNPFAGPVSRTNDRNRCATLEAHIPEPSTFEKDHTVWYRFNTPATGGPFAVRVEVTSSLPWPFGDAIDPQIAVYKSSNNLCTGTITEHFSDYSTFGLPFFERADVHCLEDDTRYFVMVDGSGLNTQGFYNITFETISPNPIAVNNNRCAVVSAATGDLGTLGAGLGNILGGLGGGDPLWNNFCSDVEPGEPVPDAFGLDQTVWFKFRTPVIAGPNDGVNVNIYLDNDISYGDQIDLQLAVYMSSDNTCTGTFTEVESSYSPVLPLFNFFDEELDLCLREDTEYWIQVDGSALNTQGYFKLRIRNDGVTQRPANDDFCNATTINVGTPLLNQSNVCATVENNEPLAGLDIQKSVWYKFTAPASGRVEIRTQDADGALSGIDPEWYLYEFDGTCVGGVFTGTFTELDNAYFPTLGIINPDDVSEYECLFPGREYYIQVDGTTVGGPEGIFNISVTNIPITAPANDACGSAIALSVNTESCQYSTGTWVNRNYGTATRTLDDVPGCGSNCGDTWYSFVMPATGFAKIEGDDEFGTFGTNNSQLVINAFRGSCGSLTQIQCDNGGSGKDPDFSITGTAGETIYLQVYSANGNTDDNKNFAICVSERCSADECPDYVTMVLGEDYCWDIRDATGEFSNQGYPVCGAPTNPEKTVYFRFDTDDFCWGYQITIETPELSANGNCLLGNSPSSELVLSVYQDDPGSLCDGIPIAVLDCETFNDCQWPSGVVWTQTYLVGPAVNNIKTNATYIIQLNARDGLPFITSDDVVDGTIRVRKLCDGREWEYAPLGVTSSNGWCEDAQGWRHYYDDAGTPADPSDDILIFSVRPNGNTFDGIATIRLENAPFSATNATAGSWVMRRHWDFNMTSGSIDPNFPVDVRFYYLDSEKNEIITAAQTFATNNGLTYEPFEWFKSANGTSYWANPGPFAPAYNITPEYVLAQYGSGNASLAILGPNSLNAEDHDADPTNEWCNGVQYVDITGLIGFSGGSGATGAGSQPSPLPVELVEFTGYHDEQEYVNVLNWKTASELNNDYFVVQRSLDGINFITIGQVEGKGTTNEASIYSFTDFNLATGKNYYRLRQVDFDGSSEFSDVISINVNGSALTTKIINYYPNPTTNKLYIEMQVSEEGTYDMTVIDVTGKVVHHGRIDLIKSNRHIVELDASYFAQGGYVVSLVERTSGERHQLKFIKQ
jgi:large repetitive protein